MAHHRESSRTHPRTGAPGQAVPVPQRRLRLLPPPDARRDRFSRFGKRGACRLWREAAHHELPPIDWPAGTGTGQEALFRRKLLPTGLTRGPHYFWRFRDVVGWPEYGVLAQPGQGLIQETAELCPFRNQPFPETWYIHGREKRPGLWLGLLRADNPYHWLVNCLPALITWETLAAETGCNRVYLNAKPNRYQKESMRLIGADRFDWVPLQDGPVALDDVYLPPYLCLGLQHFDPFVLKVRQRVLKWLGKRDLRSLAVAGPRIYISRRDSRRRPLGNEAAVEAMVKARGFEVLRLSGYSFIQQAATFARASHVIGPHGAGLAHLLFAPGDASLLELVPGHHREPCMARIAQVLGIPYAYALFPVAEGADAIDKNVPWQVDLDRLETTLSTWLAEGQARPRSS